jgi:hypothetical protein
VSPFVVNRTDTNNTMGDQRLFCRHKTSKRMNLYSNSCHKSKKIMSYNLHMIALACSCLVLPFCNVLPSLNELLIRMRLMVSIFNGD